MIVDWRAKFGLPHLAFFFVQLAAYFANYAPIRNAQVCSSGATMGYGAHPTAHMGYGAARFVRLRPARDSRSHGFSGVGFDPDV